MRKTIYFALAGAIALASVVACNKEGTDNPNYNKETNEVLTSFVFNVATANTPQTKMTSANTQATSSDGFRGIQDARLLSFLRSSSLADGSHIHDVTTANKQYALGHVMSPSDATTDQSKSHRVIELALPNETNTLMFYGKAPKTGENADFAQGKINYLADVTNANATDLSHYDFELNRIVDVNSSGYNDKFRQYGDLILAALNFITSAELNNENVTFESVNYPTTLKWTEFVTISDAGAITPATKDPSDGSPMCSIGEILGESLATLATINLGEVRAGSGPAISRTMGDLLVVMNNIHAYTPNTLYEAKAKALADKIKSRIESCFEGTAPTLTWKVVSDVVTATSYAGNTSDIIRIGSTGSALDEYPMIAFNLPAGCSQVTVTTTKSTDTDGRVTTPGTITWSYLANVQVFSANSTTSCYSVYYPAEICYWGNSPIRVTNENVIESEYPQGVANWDADASWTSKNWVKNAHVVSTTRSVAMQYNINYGTALLKSNVGYSAAVLQDNNHAIQVAKNPALSASDEPNAEITVTASTFKLKGILVGGVATKVGWNFLPVSGSTFAQCIYDKAIASDAIPASGQGADNYTLVWDNWNEAKRGQKQNDVYICLEFENNSGKDFWGQHNIIRNGGIFYIIGKLDPDAGRSTTDRSEGVTWPTDGLQCLPPHKTDGTTLKERRVFIQDFMTTANFKIGATSLQSAYSTVPDLRSTQISLGLSVDLKWETGLVFNNVVLGQ
ncbi:MAG: hypothetical protein J5640_01935 [Bacteroidales bacterium]|nr:hypothetical protein [Bacteroidales bacterium]